MTRLSVNINKIATIRNARGCSLPDVLLIASDCEFYGAQGITVHPRPDERHIRRSDVYQLKQIVRSEFNIEGYPSRDFMDMVCAVKPTQVTLVPDPPEALTSNAGWDTIKYLGFLKEVIQEFKSHGIRTSIFTDTRKEIIEGAAKTGTDRIELYTEPFATGYPSNPFRAVEEFRKAAIIAHENDLGVNAGHDLSLHNLCFFHENVPYLDEVSIGHALISDALYFGLRQTIQMYLDRLK